MKNHKNHCYLNVVFQYFYCVLRKTDNNWKFDTAYNTSSSRGVEKNLKKPSEYNAFFNDEVQQDSFECLLLLKDIMDKGFVPYSDNEHLAISCRDPLSELSHVFSSVL